MDTHKGGIKDFLIVPAQRFEVVCVFLAGEGWIADHFLYEQQ
jgi:hypothetical protein